MTDLKMNAETEAVSPWGVGAERICEAMLARSPRAVRRVTESLYEDLMNDVQDWLKENVDYNLSGEISRRDHRIALLEAERDAALKALSEANARIAGDGEALKPFADFVTPDPKWMSDSDVVSAGSPLARKQLTAGQCRAARARLQSRGTTA